MDLKPVFLPKSPPPAHKQTSQDAANPPKELQNSPLDLSCRSTSGDQPLDLSIELNAKESTPVILGQVPRPVPGPGPNASAKNMKVPVPTSPDDDVIVVDVKRGRGNPAVQSPLRGPNRTVYNMCQKEAYTGGVAYTPFDLSAGLIKLKQMIKMAKDPQQARQMAQMFQKKALQMLVKSRILQQQRQASLNELGSATSLASSSSSSSSSSSLSSSMASRSMFPRPAPSAALGKPISATDGSPVSTVSMPTGPTTAQSTADNYSNFLERSPVSQASSGVFSPEPTTVQMIKPVLVVSSINSLSRINTGVQITSGSTGSNSANLVHTDIPVHPAFAKRNMPVISMAIPSSPFNPLTVTSSSSSSTTVTSATSPSTSSTNMAFRPNLPPKGSSVANFESEYMKYVRSKRFMSGGSNITEERQPLAPTPSVKSESSMVKGEQSMKRIPKQNMAEYQYFLSELNKVTKNAIQMADMTHRERLRDGITASRVPEMPRPPPAHSKTPLNVNHKMPHRNPHLFKCTPVLTAQQRSQNISRLLSQMCYVSKTGHPKPFPHGANVMPPPPQKTESSAVVSTEMTNRPVVSNVKTWTPPVGQKSFVKQVISEETMKDVSGELIRIPNFKFAERKSPVRNDKEEFQRIYSTAPEEMDTISTASPTFDPILEQQSFQPESMHSEINMSEKEKEDGNTQSAELTSVKTPVNLTSKGTSGVSSISPWLSYAQKSSSLTITPPLTKDVTANDRNDFSLTSNVVPINSAINATMQGAVEDKQPSLTIPSSAPSIRKTMVKPVTSTFIGWNVSGYKRVPVANVNPIKVEGGQVQTDTATNVPTTSVSQMQDIHGQNRTAVGHIYQPGLRREPVRTSTNRTSGQPCLILPRPTFGGQFENFAINGESGISKPAETIEMGNQSITLDIKGPNSENVNSTEPQNGEPVKPKKRHKMKAVHGKEIKMKYKVSSKPKIKKVKMENEADVLDGDGSSSVVAKTEAIKAILRDDFQSKVTVGDVKPGSSEHSSPVPKRNKPVRKKKGVCFHSDEESDGQKDKPHTLQDEVTPKEASVPVKVKRRKRSKMLVKPKGHGATKRLKASAVTEGEVGFTNKEVIPQEVYAPSLGDSGEIPTGKLVVKISKKKKKTKLSKFESDRECCSQLFTYNKNAKYEQELLREEEHRLVLKAKRQARKSIHRSDSSLQSDPGQHGDGSVYPGDEASYGFGSEQGWQPDDGAGSSGAAAGHYVGHEDVQYEVESQPLGKRRRHPGVTLKRVMRKAMAEDLTEGGTFAGEEDPGFPRRQLKRRRRRRWYKKRKPLVYLPINYQLCLGEVDDAQYESQYMPLEPPMETDSRPNSQDMDLQEAYVDPELLAELKGVFTCRETGETKLHRLTRMGNQDLAIRCIEAKLFSSNARDHAGYTPLHESCVTGRLRVAKSLLQNGAEVNIAAQDGTRPLHDAVDNNRLELVRLLLSHGADPHTATYSGKTPLKIARTPDMQRLIKGHLQDVRGLQTGQTPDVWSFTPPWEDKEVEYLGCDVLVNPPSDCSSEEEEIEFEFWDSTPLACHHLQLDHEEGPRNYHFLRHLSEMKDIPEDDFKLLNFDLNYKTTTTEIFSQQARLHDNVLPDFLKETKTVDFVEVSCSLKSLLEIDRCVVTRAELVDGSVNDISFSETPTDRLMVEAAVIDDAAEPSTTSTTCLPVQACSRKLDFSLKDSFSKSESSSNISKTPDKRDIDEADVMDIVHSIPNDSQYSEYKTSTSVSVDLTVKSSGRMETQMEVIEGIPEDSQSSDMKPNENTLQSSESQNCDQDKMIAAEESNPKDTESTNLNETQLDMGSSSNVGAGDVGIGHPEKTTENETMKIEESSKSIGPGGDGIAHDTDKANSLVPATSESSEGLLIGINGASVDSVGKCTHSSVLEDHGNGRFEKVKGVQNVSSSKNHERCEDILVKGRIMGDDCSVTSTENEDTVKGDNGHSDESQLLENSDLSQAEQEGSVNLSEISVPPLSLSSESETLENQNNSENSEISSNLMSFPSTSSVKENQVSEDTSSRLEAIVLKSGDESSIKQQRRSTEDGLPVLEMAEGVKATEKQDNEVQNKANMVEGGDVPSEEMPCLTPCV